MTLEVIREQQDRKEDVMTWEELIRGYVVFFLIVVLVIIGVFVYLKWRG